MLRDNQVNGVTILARDITASRKNEARFTELFETLQEGIYIVTPDDRILDANPALVRMLGYDSKDDLLSHTLADVMPDTEQRRVAPPGSRYAAYAAGQRNHPQPQGWQSGDLPEHRRGRTRHERQGRSATTAP